MRLGVAVQMDPIERINIRADSTFALLLEAQQRGFALAYYPPAELSMLDGQVVARTRALSVRDEPGAPFRLGAPNRTALTEFDVVLMRQAPPFDLAYVTASHLLERI